MGRLDIILDDDLDKEFREEAFKQLGLRRGSISSAIEDAIRLWIKTNKEKRSEAAKKAHKTMGHQIHS